MRARREGTTELSPELRLRLQEAGILRKAGTGEEVVTRCLETAARMRGQNLPKRSVRISFDTFQAKSRPGLETTSSEDEESLKTDANNMTMIMLGRVRKTPGVEEDARENRISLGFVRKAISSQARAV